MNKLLIVALRMAIITYLITNVPTLGLAHTTPKSENDFDNTVPVYSEQDIKDRLDNITSVIDLNYTHEVGRRIKEYTVSYRHAGESILGKVDLYFPLFEREISKRNLPDELKYVAVVESKLDPTAKSKSGAMGMWQFMRSTGKMQGLKIDKYLDERQDPEKSTKASLDYLSHLYDRFGDWTLAMAAYNCGPGNVRKAIRRGKSKNFWEIRHHMPRETQKYVPRIIAAMYLMQYYHYHNLTPKQMDNDMRYTVNVQDGKGHNLYKLAEQLDVEYSILKSLNAQYKTKYFPKNNGRLTLVIPESKYDLYLQLYDAEQFERIVKSRNAKALNEKIELQLKTQKEREVEQLNLIEVLVPKELYSSDAHASVNISY